MAPVGLKVVLREMILNSENLSVSIRQHFCHPLRDDNFQITILENPKHLIGESKIKRGICLSLSLAQSTFDNSRIHKKWLKLTTAQPTLCSKRSGGVWGKVRPHRGGLDRAERHRPPPLHRLHQRGHPRRHPGELPPLLRHHGRRAAHRLHLGRHVPHLGRRPQEMAQD